ncbi:CAP domain-containing protein [Georgenia sp. MJ206]|uniref:CAP domain-containing protein n=1 Tax=Georgenia wangjunii TaxID=3117730 RepID=UPI002F26BD51
MTAPWSPRDHDVDRRDPARTALDRTRSTLDRTRAAVAAWPRRRTAVLSSALALTLAGGLAVAATITPDDRVDEAALAAISLEATPERTEDPVVVPDDAEWTLDATDADASVAKADVPTIREAHAASRAAERQALAEAADAAARAEAEAQAAQRPAARSGAAAQDGAAAQSSEPAQRSAPEQAPAVNAAAGSERGALTAMLNNYRAQNGLHTLARDPQLDQVAQNWARWMASNQVLQHNPNNGAEAGAGWTVSENIVRNTGGASMSPDAIVSWMFGWWQNSSVHRDNMLNARHTHVGIGYVMGPGGPYAVQLFGSR